MKTLTTIFVGQASRLPVPRASRPHPSVGRCSRAATLGGTSPGLVGRLALPILLLLAVSSRAQVQQAWVARYNNGITNGNHQALKMALDPNGNIYITGFSQSANSNLDYATIKYTPSGTPVWVARYDSTNTPSAEPTAIALDKSHNVAVTGNAATVKYDTNGNQVWTAPYAGLALAVDSNADFFVTGYSTNFDIVKLSPSGTTIWTEAYRSSEPSGPSLGESLAVDPSGNVYVSGTVAETCFLWGVETNCFLLGQTVKYSPNGAQLWSANYYGATFPSTFVRASGLDYSGNLYVLADYGDDPYIVCKLSPIGSQVWIGSDPDNDGGSMSAGLCLTPAGAVVTGRSHVSEPDDSIGTYFLSTNGAWTTSNNYISPYGVSAGLAIAADSAGNAYVTGYSPGATTSNDIVTIKYDQNGNQIWLQRYDGPAHGDDEGNAIAVDDNGNVYVAGYETVVGGGTEMVLIKYAPITLQRQSTGGIILQTQGAPGQAFDFQASTNLQNWVDLGTATADTNGVVQFDDTNAQLFNYRFYTTTPQ